MQNLIKQPIQYEFDTIPIELSGNRLGVPAMSQILISIVIITNSDIKSDKVNFYKGSFNKIKSVTVLSINHVLPNTHLIQINDFDADVFRFIDFDSKIDGIAYLLYISLNTYGNALMKYIVALKKLNIPVISSDESKIEDEIINCNDLLKTDHRKLPGIYIAIPNNNEFIENIAGKESAIYEYWPLMEILLEYTTTSSDIANLMTEFVGQKVIKYDNPEKKTITLDRIFEINKREKFDVPINTYISAMIFTPLDINLNTFKFKDRKLMDLAVHFDTNGKIYIHGAEELLIIERLLKNFKLPADDSTLNYIKTFDIDTDLVIYDETQLMNGGLMLTRTDYNCGNILVKSFKTEVTKYKITLVTR